MLGTSSLHRTIILRLRESGIDYGPSLRSISQFWRLDGEMLGEVNVPDGPYGEFSAYQVHPAILDACFQTLGAGLAAQVTENGKPEIYMPTRIDEIRVHGRPGAHLWSHAHLQVGDADAIRGDVRLLNETGHAAVEVLGLRFESLGAQGSGESGRLAL